MLGFFACEVHRLDASPTVPRQSTQQQSPSHRCVRVLSPALLRLSNRTSRTTSSYLFLHPFLSPRHLRTSSANLPAPAAPWIRATPPTVSTPSLKASCCPGRGQGSLASLATTVRRNSSAVRSSPRRSSTMGSWRRSGTDGRLRRDSLNWYAVLVDLQ